MKKNRMTILKIVLILILSITVLSISTPTIVQAYDGQEIKVAAGVIDPNDFKPSNPTNADVKPVTDKANIIIGAIRTVGVAVTMITLMVMGIKYMTGSIEEKAEYKKTMIPYLVGALIFFGLTQFLAIIVEVAQAI